MREFILFCSLNLTILISISSVVSFSIRHPAYVSTTPASNRSNIPEPYFPRGHFHYKTKIDNSTETITVKSVVKTEHDTPQDNESMENVSFFPRYSLLLQVLIFICCAAGVSAILILCCIVCLNSLQFSRSSIVLGDDGRVHIRRSNNCRLTLNNVQLQQNMNNESSILTFIPSNHHPWSPSVNNEEAERFTFQLQTDLPPSYDDLPTKEEETISSPPPPYTPSFQNTKENVS